MHSHIIWGVDDGPGDVEKTLDMLKIAHGEGIEHIVATPHYISGVCETNKEEIIEKTKELNELAKKAGHNIKIHPGQEIYADSESITKLEAGELLTLNNSRYALVEFNPALLHDSIVNVLETLAGLSIVPVIAHAERIIAFGRRDMEFIEKLVSAGAIIQVNADSVTGACGLMIKRRAHKLLKAGLVHVISSDCHSADWRPPMLSEAKKEISKKYGISRAELLMLENPMKIINNGKIL